MCKPAILRTFAADFLIAPTSAFSLPVKELILQHDIFTIENKLGYNYQRVENEINADGEVVGIKVYITATDGDDVQNLELSQTFEGVANSVDCFNHRLQLAGISDDESTVRVLLLPSLDEAANLPVTANVTCTPYMCLMWFSFFLITAGLAVSFILHF